MVKEISKNLGVTPNTGRPIALYCNSQVSIAYSKDPKYHKKSKHIETKYNFVRDIIVRKLRSNHTHRNKIYFLGITFSNIMRFTK